MDKDPLSDAMVRDLIEHFSALEFTVANELGRGYEYLIKKFADDSGHTAAEFYTNRTVVHLMTENARTVRQSLWLHSAVLSMNIAGG